MYSKQFEKNFLLFKIVYENNQCRDLNAPKDLNLEDQPCVGIFCKAG